MFFLLMNYTVVMVIVAEDSIVWGFEQKIVVSIGMYIFNIIVP